MPELSQGLVAGSSCCMASLRLRRCQEQVVERNVMGHQMGPCDLALLSV